MKHVRIELPLLLPVELFLKIHSLLPWNSSLCLRMVCRSAFVSLPELLRRNDLFSHDRQIVILQRAINKCTTDPLPILYAVSTAVLRRDNYSLFRLAASLGRLDWVRGMCLDPRGFYLPDCLLDAVRNASLEGWEHVVIFLLQDPTLKLMLDRNLVESGWLEALPLTAFGGHSHFVSNIVSHLTSSTTNIAKMSAISLTNAINLALRNACENDHAPVVEILLNLDPELSFFRQGEILTTAATFASSSIFQMLLCHLEHQALITDSSEESKVAQILSSCLTIACKKGRVEIVRLILNSPLIIIEANGCRYLVAAIRHSRVDVVTILLQDDRIDACGFRNEALIEAKKMGNVEILDLLNISFSAPPPPPPPPPQESLVTSFEKLFN